MSVTHPLLKELKAHVLQLLDSPKPITDENGEILPFCECLEKIFCRGVKPLKNAIGIFRSPECWYWLEQVSSEKLGAPYSYISSVASVKKCPKVNTNKGRMRLLIRTMLVKRCVHVPVQIIIEENRLPSYYKSQYILGDEILSEMLLSILKLLPRMEFKLDVNRSRFLDDTWVLPASNYLNLVPCSQLGLSVMFVDGKAVVFDIAPYSVASETEKIKIGDILDDLNGYPITDHVQGALSQIIKKSSGQPITAHVIKANMGDYLFPPLVPLLSRAGLEPANVIASYSKDSRAENQKREGSQVVYLGQVETGEKGDVKEINQAIGRRLGGKGSPGVDVTFDYHDLGLRVFNSDTREIILDHSFLEISACGTTVNKPTYFAYIAGDKSYTECKNFKCHIFQCHDIAEIENLLKNIAQGFKRTHCTA